MPILKPPRGTQLNKSHPFARGLVGAYLYNEGSGGKVFDLSGNNNIGTLYYDSHFASGVFGSALDFDGSADHVRMNPISLSAFSFSIWVKADYDDFSYVRCLIYNNIDGSARQELTSSSTANRINLYITNNLYYYFDSINWDDGYWHHLIGTWDGTTAYLYFDGVQYGSDGSGNPADDTSIAFRIGIRGGGAGAFDGRIDNVLIFDRALSRLEVEILYHEPFAMFGRGISPASIYAPGIIELAGTISAQSALTGKLTLSCRIPELEKTWLRDALFHGMTANAFKLGTVLTSGWFWVRVNGCTALYRGCSMEQIDFDNILAVSEPDADQINPPTFIPHDTDSIYFYVIRRFNNCGYQERTLSAAVKVSIKSDGDLKEPEPNTMYSFSLLQAEGNKIKIFWFYCPLEQKSPPSCFRIYYDNASRQIDYENPLAVIKYQGCKYYSYESSYLQAGNYLFAVRAESIDGIQDESQAQLRIQLDILNPEQVNILETEVV